MKTEKMGIKGIVSLIGRNGLGEVFYEEKFDNLIMNAGLAEVAKLVGNTGAPVAFTYLANGSGVTAPAATQTTLVTENTGNGSDRASATVSTVTTTVTDDTLQLVHTWTFSATKTVAEVGIFNDASAGDMLGRVLPTSNTYNNGDSLQVTYKIVFS